MADDKDLSPLEKMNQEERKITLEGPKDPDHFKMPDGSTLTETRRRLYEEQVEEATEADKVQTARVREQSTEHDPLYNPAARAVEVSPGSFSLIPAEATATPEKKEMPPNKEITQPPVSIMTADETVAK